jgi:hypothetical protein
VTSVTRGAEIAVLDGLDTGLNPALGSLQHYPSGSGHTNPAADGQYVTISATVTSAPEPSTLILAALGGLALLAWRCRRALQSRA